jgi:hypothetical protein
MIRKIHTTLLLVAAIGLSACSTVEQLNGIASCPGWVPEDRTCDVSQRPEYRSDTLRGPGLVIIK